MASGPSTLAKVDNILKEVYLPGINDQLQSEIVTLKRIQSTTQGLSSGVGGKYVRFATKMARNHGIGARREMEALPAARVPTWKDGTLRLSYQYGSLQLSGQTLELAETNAQAFASALEQHMSDLKENLAVDVNRQVYGTSRGTLMTAASGTTTTAVASDAAAQYMEMDMYIDIWDASLGAFDANGPFTVTGISSSGGNTTVTFSPASANAVASGDLLSRQGSAIDATTGKEIIGFSEIVAASGTLHGIDPSSFPEWASTVNSNGGTNRALSEGLMIKMMDDVRRKGSRPSVIFTSLGVRRAYFNLLVQQREFVNTKKFTGGHEGLAFTYDGEIPVVADLDAPANKMWFITEKELRLYQESDWHFLNRDGSNWRMVQQDGNYYDAWSANMVKYFNLGTVRRNAHGLLSDITEG